MERELISIDVEFMSADDLPTGIRPWRLDPDEFKLFLRGALPEQLATHVFGEAKIIANSIDSLLAGDSGRFEAGAVEFVLWANDAETLADGWSSNAYNIVRNPAPKTDEIRCLYLHRGIPDDLQRPPGP